MQQYTTTNYSIALAGDPDFNDEQPANHAGFAHIDIRNGRGAYIALGIVDLDELPEGYILAKDKLKTEVNGTRETATVTFQSINGIPDCDHALINNKDKLKLS